MRKGFAAKRVAATAMAVAMTTMSLAGCSSGNKEGTTKAEETTQAASGETTVAVAETTAGEENDKPYAGTKLTWWVKLNANVSATYPNLGDTPWAKYVQEKTGIEIEFIHPTVGSEAEEFSIMVASGEYPDIIEYTWTAYSGGPGAAISDGVIIDLNDVVANKAPNFAKLLADHPNIDKMVKTSNGDYYCFPFLRGTESPNLTQFSGGLILRKMFWMNLVWKCRKPSESGIPY